MFFLFAQENKKEEERFVGWWKVIWSCLFNGYGTLRTGDAVEENLNAQKGFKASSISKISEKRRFSILLKPINEGLDDLRMLSSH